MAHKGDHKNKPPKQKSKGLHGVNKVNKRVKKKGSTSCKTLADGTKVCKAKDKTKKRKKRTPYQRKEDRIYRRQENKKKRKENKKGKKEPNTSFEFGLFGKKKRILQRVVTKYKMKKSKKNPSSI